MSRLKAKTSLGLVKGFSPDRPASHRSNDNTSPRIPLSSLSCEVTSCITDGDICIESIDLLKFYHQKTRLLQVAVRIIDPKIKPVNMAEVTLVAKSPGGQSHPWRRLTDEDGVVSFEMRNPARGEWNVWVTGVSHPLHGSESYNLIVFPLTTNV